MKKIVLMIVLCLPLLNIYSQKKEHFYPPDKPVISITCPSDWEEMKDDKNFGLVNNDMTIIIAFELAPQANNLKDAVKIVNKEQSESMSKVNLDGESSTWDANGIKFYQQNEIGIRKVDKKELYLTVTYFIPDGKTKLICCYGATPEADKQYEKVVNDIMESIKNVRK
jgi:hypothetical protein